MQSLLKGILRVIHLKTRQIQVPETRAWKVGLFQIGEEISESLWTLLTTSGPPEAQIILGMLCDDGEEKASTTGCSPTAGRKVSLKELVIFCQNI